MSKKPKKTSATVVLAVVLLFSGIAVIAASFGMQEWQIRQDADEYEALMQSVKAPPQSPMEESSKPDENAADAASTDIPMQSEESPAGIPVSTDVPMATASPPPEQSAAPVSDAASRTAASGASGIDLAACKAQNSDFIAWLQIPGTSVNYPVVQTTDNTKYYRMNFEGEYSEHAVPFVDASDDLQKPSTNVIVYGHNIRTDGQMFNILKGYTDLSFYQEHSVIDFNSVYHDGQYKIISVFYTNTHAEHGKIFPYHEFIDAQDPQQTQDYIDSVLVRSIINTGVDVRSDDQLLTLSTCSYEFKDARFVVVARKVRKGESASVDTSAAVMNPNPLYPDVWYQLFGGTKPDEAQLKAALHSAS